MADVWQNGKKVEEVDFTGGTFDADGRKLTPGSGGGGGSVATDTIWDAKGDLVAATGADAAVRVAVGPNDYALTADSAEASGVKWAEVYAPSGTDVAVADGGTGASTAANARTNLGLGTAAVLASTALPGYEIGYDQVTSVVSIATGSSEGSPDTLISCAAHTFDGDPVMVEFFAPVVTLNGSSGTEWVVALYEGGSEIGRLTRWTFSNSAAINRQELVGRLRITPSAGSHTYTVGGADIAGTPSSGGVGGGAGSGAAYPPMYVRFTKV